MTATTIISRTPAASTTSTALDADVCWQSVQARDASADGRFVFAVRSTGIYCRPSCPARRPGPDRVAYFPTPEDAEAAGFRPCRRCRPKEADPNAALAASVCRHIEAHLDGATDLPSLAAHAGVSPTHLHRVFKRVTGVTPREYAEALRLQGLKSSLRAGETVTDSMLEAGYSSTSRLYEKTPSQLGMTPGAYRRGGEGARIAYAITGSPLGRLLVAATSKGVCFVALGDTDEELASALEAEYPAADIARDDERLEGPAAVVLRLLGDEPASPDLPLDIRATAFQRRVWSLLQQIPRGETRTYTEIARELGMPHGARAVARACATNPTSLVIPCHRVVREDGGLAGYRWGIDRKRDLLEKEKTSCQDP